MLTVLFIGGASGSAQLLGCQQNDGAGGACLDQFILKFLKFFIPRRRVNFATVVDIV